MTSDELKELLTEYIEITKNNLEIFAKHSKLFPKADPKFKTKAWTEKGKEKVAMTYESSTGKRYKNKSKIKNKTYRNVTLQRGSKNSGYLSSGNLAPYIAILNENHKQTVNNGIYPFYYYDFNDDVLLLKYGKSNAKIPNPTWTFSKTGEKLDDRIYKKYYNASTSYKSWDFDQMLSDLDDMIDDYEIALGIDRTKRADGTEGSGTGYVLAAGEAGLGGEKKDGDPKKGGVDDKNPSHPLNLILYGPPGTGKTYNTLFKALEIIEGKAKEELESEIEAQDAMKKADPDKVKRGYQVLKDRYDHYVETGQIVFSTFHQSMSYEDFIEGIKPIPIEGDIKAIHENDPKSKKVLFGDGSTTISNLSRMKYDVRDGIFKKIADSANKNRQESEDKDGKIISVQKLLNAFCDYAENNNEGTYLTKDGKKWHEIVPRRKDNEDRDVLSFVIKYGSGQHLTFSIINRDWESFKKGEIKTANDIKPKSGSQPKHGNAKYYFALYKALEKFEKEHKLTQQKSIERLNYVLIIDEINRGNVAQIFGELITLIEPSKRLGNDEEMTATLPYSSTVNPDAEPFGVPNNLYIIGTMNTADRSVEALDTALRRRFSFEEMMPKPKLLGDKELCDVKLSDLLTTINQRIVALKDREHQIGHSYFMGLETDSDLKDVFKDKIIPLLQEYFYGDYKKIYYVLGPGFVENSFSGKNQDSIRKELFPFVDSNDQELDISEERYEIRPFNDDPNDKRDNKVVIKAAVHELINSEEYQKKEKDFKEKYKGTTFKKGDGKKIDVKYVIERTFGGENISDFQEETVE